MCMTILKHSDYMDNMNILDVFLIFWLILLMSMCGRLCYDIHIENKKKPLLSENELSESSMLREEFIDHNEPPYWVQNQ